jgi:plastocyanin
MRGWVNRRGMSIVVGAVLLVVLAPALAWASGGGGCGRAVTDRDGTRVGIRNFCFGPTILRVRPGETVTWVNRDAVPHTVLGANGAWGGYDTVRRNGGRVAFRFVSSGVYPYVCTYHPGMIGAVVVGNGRPVASAHAVTTNAGPVTPAGSGAGSETTVEQQNVVPTPVAPGSGAAAVAWGLAALFVVVAGRALARRRGVTHPGRLRGVFEVRPVDR